MKKTFGILCVWLSFLSSLSFAQSELLRVYTWEEAQNTAPELVKSISFAKEKRTELPAELANYTALISLDLSKNKLTELPDFIGSFRQLEELNLGKNNLFIFPAQICQLSSLKRLIVNRNNFSEMPECIKFLKNFEYIDLWDTPMNSFPAAFTEMPTLKKVDARGVLYGPSFQAKWRNQCPTIQFVFDPPCNCAE